MALYTVLESPDGRPEKTAVVREGFSLWAAVFMVFWALWHRMWVVALLTFVLSVALELAAQVFRLDSTLVSFAGLAVSLIFGFEARRLQMMSLERAGYTVAGVIAAKSRESAELQYFAGRPLQDPTEKAPPPASPPLPALTQHHDALGLFGSH